MDLPSGYVTFLFTDIEGSTRLFRALGDAYVPLLERHNDLLRTAWAHHDGVEVKTEGDAFFVAFSDPADTIEAAIEAQQLIAAEPWEPAVEVKVRMGIHSGLAAPRNGDYIAFSVHQAARVVGAAHGGQVLVSQETRHSLNGAGSKLHSVGRFRIRDFDEPIELFQVDVPGLPPMTLLPRATPAMGHNLNQPTNAFIGREDDIELVTGMIRAGGLASIVGPGGAGKTRMSIELGLRLTDEWPDGVWIVELAPLSQGGALAPTLAETLGLSVAGRDPLEAVIEDLAGKSVILILDNCEHVVDAAADMVTTLLRRVPTIAVLATSREPLGLGHEEVWRIDPLHTDSEANQLFIDRATAAGLDADLTEDDMATIERICARLDGNALAIELAAARVATVGLAALEASLDDRFHILSSRRRDLEPRQRSMTALLDWSYDLLEQHEQAVLRRLALFADNFTMDGAERAAIDGDLDRGAVIDAVWALTDKSLIRIDGSENQTRYVMSETLREYALALIGDDEATAVVARLGDWYLQLFGPWTSLDTGELSIARVELDNLRDLIPRLAEHDQEKAQYLATSIGYVLDVLGEAIPGAEELDGYVRMLDAPTPARTILLAAAARLHHRRGVTDYGELLDEADALLAGSGPEPDWASGKVAYMRAMLHSDLGEHDAAKAVAETIGGDGASPVTMARRYSALGLVMGDAGDAEGALEALRAGLAVEEEMGDPLLIAIGHNNLAEHALQAGRSEEAAEHQLEALEIAAQMGSVVLVAYSLVIASRLAAAAGRWEDAIRLHGAAERWLEQSGATLHGRDAEISEELLADGRQRLGDAYETIWSEGHETSLADAIAAARDELSPAAASSDVAEDRQL